jgi:hypothetical protein
MTTTERDPERVKALLRQDLRATVGGDHEATLSKLAANAWATAGASDYAQKVVDDVQQFLHDTFADSTWPTCPRHSQHPLWYRDGNWWCGEDDVAIAALGELRSLASSRE